jgi:hypothetical protein
MRNDQFGRRSSQLSIWPTSEAARRRRSVAASLAARSSSGERIAAGFDA